MSDKPRGGGRPAQISLEDISQAALELGLARVSVQGVARALGVTPTALYRHVDGKLGLERLVGEAVLAELQLVDDPEHSASEYLMSLAHQMRAFALARPGMTAYLQSMFPRGESGARLMRSGIESLARRGYTPDVAGMVCSGVATVAISLAAAEERHDLYAEGPERATAEAALAADSLLASSTGDLPEISFEMYFHMVMTAFIQGLTTAAPTNRPLPEIFAALGLNQG